MPKAPRDKESTTPKKRVRKTAPATGKAAQATQAENGNGAVAATVTVPSEAPREVPVSPSINIEEKIRERAYQLYLQRGDKGGSPEQDWLRAVEEICGQQRTA